MSESRTAPPGGDRLAKVMARSGLCSRRDAEEWIKQGRVVVNGKKVLTPAFNVTDSDDVRVDGAPLAERQGTRVWLYHKPAGLMVTEKDPEGRPTIFEKLSEHGLPRVVSIGRLDFNTEGLLLLTNDGGLKRVLELPATGWLRKYRVRAHGTITQAQLDTLKGGVTVDGIKYGPIEAILESERGANVWLEVSLREGKNREVRNVLFTLGLEVNRLIRISYGPFQLGEIPIGGIEAVKARVLKDQLGKRLAEEAGADFVSDQPGRDPSTRRAAQEEGRSRDAGKERLTGRGTHTTEIARQRFRFTDRAERAPNEARESAPRPSRPGRPTTEFRRRPAPVPAKEEGPPRQILFDDGSEPKVFEEKLYGAKPKREAGGKPGGKTERAPGRDAEPARPARSFGDKPRASRSNDAPRPAGRPRSPRPEGEDRRPARVFGDKPRAARPVGDAPRPARSLADKPRSSRPIGERPTRPTGDKPRTARPGDDRPRPARSFGDKPRSSRPGSEGARTPRSPSDKPRSPRPAGARPGRPPGSSPRGPGRDKPSRGPRGK